MKDLPLELWVEILRGLDPIDVLRLAQASTALRTLLFTRSIWTTILQWTCETYGLFEPSYPVDEMDIPHIQRVCLGPSLWRSLVGKLAVSIDEVTSQSPTMQPTSSLSPVHTIGTNTDTSIKLVPGGRFLVILSPPSCPEGTSTGGTLLRIWDVGVAGAPILDVPTLIGELDTGIPWSPTGMVVMTCYSSKTSLSILVSTDDYDSHDGGECWLSVYGVQFPKRGRFEGGLVPLVQLSELILPKTKLGRGWYIVSFLGTRILLACKPFVLVWDFVEGKHVCLRIATARDNEYPMPVFFDGTSYCAVKAPELDTGWVFSVPDLRPGPPQFLDGIPTYTVEEPCSTFPIPITGLATEYSFLSFGNGSYLAPGFPVFWDICSSSHGPTPFGSPPTHSLTRYAFRKVEASGETPEKILFEPILRAMLKEPPGITIKPYCQDFGPQFLTSMQLRVTSLKQEFIYSLALIDMQSSQQSALDGEGDHQVDQGGGGESTPATRAAALMLTPLFNDRAFWSSCVSSGRLLHADIEGESLLADYLW